MEIEDFMIETLERIGMDKLLLLITRKIKQAEYASIFFLSWFFEN